MTSQAPKILIVDDDPGMAETCAKLFRRQGWIPLLAKSGKEALAHLEADSSIEIVLTDLIMPELSGVELLQAVKRHDPRLEVILMTGYGTIPTAVEAMRLGAADYITKPFDKTEILAVVEKILTVKGLQEEVRTLQAQLKSRYGIEELVGQSKPMRHVFARIRAAAAADCPVLIAGETGTGKELVARAIHRLSSRASRPFVPVNCTALPKDLLESELFGHSKGAYTGAHMESKGLFRAADQGTILLDEIGDMPIEGQAKLLRVLQEKAIRPIGETSEIPVDVRVLAATNQPLATLLETGRLRSDLYYRLSVITIEVPPLRQRHDDIPLLAQYFIQLFNARYHKDIEGIDREVLDCLMGYPWPGNVRELENLIEGLFALRRLGKAITLNDLPPSFKRLPLMPERDAGAEVRSLAQAEETAIVRALKASRGNKSKAAELLGISRDRLYRKLELYGIQDD
ncbi:MAG TPA: sigma-54 dependent transcriptional regulator [Candidatus Tectomicrobia bacterium]|nr:sigma-54 dependent transcriptional regulator [Candidatus Tectomicrobia bacterium]